MRFLEWIGLTTPPEGSPQRPGPRRSRYGIYVSRRVDEDIDELRVRVAELELRLKK